MAPTLLDLPTSLNTLRYAAPIKQGGQGRAKVEADPRNPAHWDNARLRTWVSEASKGAINPEHLCPWESGRQILRIPETEFLRRVCQANKKVSLNKLVEIMIIFLDEFKESKGFLQSAVGATGGRKDKGEEEKDKEANEEDTP